MRILCSGPGSLCILNLVWIIEMLWLGNRFVMCLMRKLLWLGVGERSSGGMNESVFRPKSLYFQTQSHEYYLIIL
jgi:hypothetical protein